MAGERNKIGVRRSPNGVLRSDENRTGKLKYILIQQIHSAIILYQLFRAWRIGRGEDQQQAYLSLEQLCAARM